MFPVKILSLVALASGFYVSNVPEPNIDLEDLTKIFINNAESSGGDYAELADQVLHSVYPGLEIRRQKRQLHGSGSANPTGGLDINLHTPLAETDHTKLSAIGTVSGLGKNTATGYNSAGAGLAFGTDKGHGATILAQHIPDFGERATAAGKVNLFHTDNHKLDANAFTTRNFPSNPQIPAFSTHGGSLDYLYKDRIGASLAAAYTPIIQKTDYSAMGKFNIFKDPTSSLDFNAGFSKSTSPYFPSSSWQPSAGIGYTKSW